MQTSIDMPQNAASAPKQGFFRRMGQAIKNVLPGRAAKRTSDFETYSKFKQFYDTLDENDPFYPAIRQAATLCDDALRVARQRMRANGQLHEINDKMLELEAFINLTDEEASELKKLLDRFVALSRERSLLLEKLSNYDSALVDMTPLEEDARTAVSSIKDAEKQQRALKMDLGYLMGEKEELVHERVDMSGSLDFIRRFTIGAVGLFMLVAAVLLYQLVFTQRNVFLPAALLVVITMTIVALLSVFGQRLRKEMRLNLRKQHKAVEMLNKKSVVYAYYTNYLRFCYDKYKAKNSRNLETNLNDLESYRQLTGRIDTVRSLLYETEETVDRFLRVKKLNGVNATIEGFAATVKLEDKRRVHKTLSAQKAAAEKELAALDTRHEEIWESLMVLGESDPSQRVEAIIEAYLNEAGKLFATLGEAQIPAIS